MIINRLSSSLASSPKIIINKVQSAVQNGQKTSKMFKNEKFGKILEGVAKNEVVWQSGISLAICAIARPATNFAITPNKKDAAYASAQSISSGVMGFIWPIIFATPLAAAVGVVFKNPQKYLKPNVIKKLYPSVGLHEVMEKGKKVTKVMTNANGEMLRADGTKLWKTLTPLKIRNADAASKLKNLEAESTGLSADVIATKKLELEKKHAKFTKIKTIFETTNPEMYVDNNGVVRSKTVFQTKNGIIQKAKGGEIGINGINSEIGAEIQIPGSNHKIDKILSGEMKAQHRPITEEMKDANKKEQNIQTMIKWSTDIILAPPRAILTILAIPPLLKAVGMEKNKKGKEKKENITTPTPTNQNLKSIPKFSIQHNKFIQNFKKGGV